MIQRKQTLFLLLVVILMGLTLLLPLATFNNLVDGTSFKLYSTGLKSIVPAVEHTIIRTPYLLFLNALCVLLPLVTIFLFKKRSIQLRLCTVEIVLLLGAQVFIFFYMFHINKTFLSEYSVIKFSLVDIMPLVSIIFTWLAFRGILRDDLLVKSLHRIR